MADNRTKDTYKKFCLQSIGRGGVLTEDQFGVHYKLGDLGPVDTGKQHGPEEDPDAVFEELEYRKYKRFRERYEREILLAENKPESWTSEHRDYWGHNCTRTANKGWLIPLEIKYCDACGVERP